MLFRSENLYRLFAPQRTSDGTKIPYLNKATIFKLIRTIGKNACVAVYTQIEHNTIKYNIVCEFQNDGVINVYPLNHFDMPVSFSNSTNIFSNIDEIMSLAVNPLIHQIKPFFEQSGLELQLFTSIQSSNVEIRDMLFETVYNINKPINIDKIEGCISSAFIVESSNFKKGIAMRFKRVSNFDKRDSQEAFIIEKIQQGLKLDEIVDDLIKQFPELDKDAAEEQVIQLSSELEINRGIAKSDRFPSIPK